MQNEGRAGENLSRREFLKSGLAGLAVTPLMAAETEVDAGRRFQTSTEMQYRILGKRTNLKVSEIGFGGYAINDPEVIHYASDRGINYIDTAWCYRDGASEENIGKAMKKLRNKFVLTTKWHPWGKTTKKEMMEMINTSLKRLQTDYVDCLLVHQVGQASGGESLERLQNPELYEAYEQAKKEGKVRFSGVSGHDGDLMEIMNWVIDKGFFDVILMRYSFMQYQEQKALIQRAYEKGIGVVAMKVLSGAKGEDDPKLYQRDGASFKQAAIKWVLSNPHVSNLIITINSKNQVDEYAPVSGSRFGARDREILDYYARVYRNEICTFCNACEPSCPHHLAVADILRFYMYAENYHLPEQGQLAYASLPVERRADHCIDCSAPCMDDCPSGVNIKREMKKAYDKLSIADRLPLA